MPEGLMKLIRTYLLATIAIFEDNHNPILNMRILHIGDFHYKSNKNLYEQKNVVDKLIQHLKTSEPIDYLIFTGDLVHSGEKESDFAEAHKAIFVPLHKFNRVRKQIIQ